MSTLRVNNIQSVTSTSPVSINDSLIISGNSIHTSTTNGVAFGSNTLASGSYTFAHGGSTIAKGLFSHAEGNSTIAQGNYSHAEGSATFASGGYAHAEGRYSSASGNYSHAEGLGTIASGPYQHTQGRYNIADSNENTLVIIGNGTSTSTRSNLAVFKTGSILLDTGSIPTSSVGASVGQLYRTGSNFDEIRIKLV